MPIDKTPWTDATVIKWGAHAGKRLVDVPIEYLSWLSEQRWLPDYPGLKAYLSQPSLRERISKARAESQPTDLPAQQYGSYDDYLKDYRGI